MTDKNKKATPAEVNAAPTSTPAEVNAAPAPTTEVPSTNGGRSFKVKKQLTRQPLNLVPGLPKFIRVDSDYYELPPEVTIKQAKGQPRPLVLDVTDLETGVGHSMIMYAVLKSELDKAYPNSGDKVGKELMIVRHDARGAKGYCTFDIAELEGE